jgi:hypothetical protein
MVVLNEQLDPFAPPVATQVPAAVGTAKLLLIVVATTHGGSPAALAQADPTGVPFEWSVIRIGELPINRPV